MKPRSYIPTVSEIEAILAGRKTRFSVPVKPQPSAESFSAMVDYYDEKPKRARFWTKREVGNPFIQDIKCPFTPGMLVYCREKWQHALNTKANKWVYVYSDGTYSEPGHYFKDDELYPIRFESPATMPKEAARIILRVVGVKVERVQDISEEDARKEGYPVIPSPGTLTEEGMRLMTPQRWFSEQWGRRTRYNPALANPWIFAVHFEVASTQGWEGING